MGPSAVIVKGGHRGGRRDRRPAVRRRALRRVSDAARPDAQHPRHRLHVRVGRRRVSRARALARRRHGAGAQAYVVGAIRHGLAIGKGHGPLDHFWQIASPVKDGQARYYGRTAAIRLKPDVQDRAWHARSGRQLYRLLAARPSRTCILEWMSTPLLAIGPEPLALEPLVAAVTERRAARRGGSTERSRRFWAWFATTTSAGASDISSTRRTSRSRGGRSSGLPARSRPLARRPAGAAPSDRPARDRRGQRRDRGRVGAPGRCVRAPAATRSSG